MKGNSYIINDNYTELIIKSNKYGVIKVKIDFEDIERCKDITWHYSNSRDIPYICGKIKNKNIKLHRYLLDLYDNSLVVDHINRNTLDNRKCNLRIANYQENSFNRRVRSDNSTGFTGIDYNKRNKKWRAKIKYNNVNIHLGYFRDINDALVNRRIAEHILFGVYSTNTSIENIDSDLMNHVKENVMERISKKVS